MALKVLKGPLPQGTVLLDEKEALRHQWNTVFHWKPRADVWPFTYGLGALAGCTALTSIYVSNYYRRKLKLQTFGRIASYFPNVMIPSLLGTLLHQLTVSNNILLHKGSCPLCLEMKGAFIQLMVGVIYPLVLGPAAAFLLASRYGTYRMPSLTHDYKSVMQLYIKLTRRASNNFLVIATLQMVAGVYITHKEFKSLFRVEEKLNKQEEDYLNKAN